MTNNPKTRPVRTYTAFPIELAVWSRAIESEYAGRALYSVTVQRVYKDEHGQWQRTRNLHLEDLPKLAQLLPLAFADFGVHIEQPTDG